jgi:hypothetical protein
MGKSRKRKLAALKKKKRKLAALKEKKEEQQKTCKTL